MRVFILLLLTLSAVPETESFILDFFWELLEFVGDMFDWGMTAFNRFVDTTFKIGSTAIGAVVDPFDWWKPSVDEHGHNAQPEKVAKCPARSDILFVFDTSGSISLDEFQLAKQFANRLTQHFQISDKDVRFAAITFGDRVEKVFDFKTYSDHGKLNMAVSFTTPRVGGSTKTYLALEYIIQQNLFSTKNGARDVSSKIVIVITDGSSDSLIRTNSAASALQKNYHVVSVGIGAGLGVELHNIASGYKNVFTADTYSQLVRIEQRVARRLCEIPEAEGNIPITSSGDGCAKGFRPNPNKPNSCVDINECAEKTHSCEGLCKNMPGGYRCYCKAGNVIDVEDTSKCKSIKLCNALIDIIYVIDASGSIGTVNFEVQQTFLSKLVHHFKYGAKGAQFGAILFGTEAEKLFDLKTYTESRTDCTKAINAAPYIEGITNTHLALQNISSKEMFSSGRGGRDNAKKVVVIVTDGDASDKEAAKAAASSLKEQGVEIFALAIGELVKLENLLEYVSHPKNVFASVDFELLDYIEESLAQRICSRAG